MTSKSMMLQQAADLANQMQQAGDIGEAGAFLLLLAACTALDPARQSSMALVGEPEDRALLDQLHSRLADRLSLGSPDKTVLGGKQPD
jgi:hypothetical protein